MRRLALGAALLCAVTLGLTGSAWAAPVSRATARTQILRTWRGTKPPRIVRCTPKRYGTLCLLGVPFAKSNRFGAVRGLEMQCVWVSRTRGRDSVSLLWATLSVRVSL